MDTLNCWSPLEHQFLHSLIKAITMKKFQRLLKDAVYFGFVCVVGYLCLTDPVVNQTVHRYFVGHDIPRSNRALHDTNSSRNRFCGKHQSYEEMCPTPYTQLASCELTENNGFDCPDIRRNGTTKLRQAQLVITRMLRIFDLIARKYNMPYWIRSGTLIGAVRHQGFIPWDDDIDIEIPLKYYIDFFENYSKELSDDMFFQTSATDTHYHPQNSNWRYTGDLYSRRVGRYWPGSFHPKIRDRSSCYCSCYDAPCGWHDGLQLDIFVSSAIPWGIFPLREMQFEGFNVLVPNNWNSVISSEYPHFMELPRKEDRVPKNLKIDPTHSCDKAC